MSIKPQVGGTAASAETPLQQVTMRWAKEHILKNLFYRFSGSRPDMEERLQKVYAAKYKRPMRKVGRRDVRATYLESEPGHGKTTTHKEACREFSQLMGLRFVEDVTLRDLTTGKIDRNCFVFTTINLGGATSKMEIGGLMAKLKVLGEADANGKREESEFMGHLPDWRMAATMMGAYGYALFDDFPTSSHQVQNACLDFLLGGSAGDLQFNANDLAASSLKCDGKELVGTIAAEKLTEHVRGSSPVHMGLAGNRGVRDGNKVFPITTATATRVERLDVQDTLADWTERARARFTDATGDAYYPDFLREHPEYFSVISEPMNGILPQMPTPRSNDALMSALGDLMHEHGGFETISKSPELSRLVVDDVTRLAGAHIGAQLRAISGKEKKVLLPATAVAGFYEEMLIGAIPVAQDIIKHGKVDSELIQSKYNNGNEGQGQNFGYQLMTALARTAASEMAQIYDRVGGAKAATEMEDPKSATSLELRKVLMHLAWGMSFVKLPLVTFATHRFTESLSRQCPEFFTAETNYKIPKLALIKTFMQGLIGDNTRFVVDDMKSTLIDAFTQFGAEASLFEDSAISKHLKDAKAAGRDKVKAASL